MRSGEITAGNMSVDKNGIIEIESLKGNSLRVSPDTAPAYDVIVHRGFGPELATALEQFKGRRFFVLSHKGLEDILVKSFLGFLDDFLPGGFDRQDLILLEQGEKNKSLARLGDVYDTLILRGVDRRSILFALGGGVVGDFVGFVAATLLRGVDFIQIPTTLLAAVDSSVGGKTAVNVSQGKNMVGAFHQPRLVYFNIDLLKTLPDREWDCGLAEMVKHAFLESSGRVYGFMLENYRQLRAPGDALARAVLESISVKRAVVNQDEKERGLRAVLNLGHSAAHAIESLTNYEKFSHGEAVSRGLVTALLLSRITLGLSLKELEEMLALMEKLDLPMDTQGFSGDEILAHMQFDKKVVDGKPRFVLLEGRGAPQFDLSVAPDEFKSAWSEQAARFG